MKILFLGLAFCSCAYLGLGCLAQAMSGPAGSPLPATFILFRTFTACCTVLCFISVWRVVPAAGLVWVAAIAFDLLSWKWNAHWVFLDDLYRFSPWPPLFLTGAALAEIWKKRSSRKIPQTI
jgi:hypothetical protein